MNHAYRLVWNDAAQCQVPAPENARGRGKRSTVGRAVPADYLRVVGRSPTYILKLLAAAILATFALDAHALPTGGAVSAGSGSIAQSGSAMTVNQASQNLAVNWQSFNIGAAERVSFVQPNASAIALNRVLGSDPSKILGQLNANGQVWVLNPNGLLFGSSAQVNVGGLVASTLNISDADFIAGKRTFSLPSPASGGGARGEGGVVNQGSINASSGGYVALLGGQVSNEGVITAQLGTVALAAGNQITLDFNGDKLLNVQVDQGAVNALAENKQLIQADGGTVLMTAQAADALTTAVVNNTGVIEARTIENHGGVIKLLGDMQSGTVNVGGTLDASAPNGGDGGFIETSAAHVKIANSARVTTLAANGNNGTWLIDPVDFTIAASGGDMTGATLATNLAGGNVIIQSILGAAGTAGDVNVNDTVTWSANTLTLNAQNNININAAMNGSGTAGLALEYGQSALAAGNTSTYNVLAPVNLASTGSFSTKLGSNGATDTYTILTSLGSAGSTTGTDLQGMNGNLGGKYVLGANIDAGATSTWNSGAGFAPVGDNSSGTNTTRFTGIFDGLGHTIDGLTINRPTTNYVGLFGYTQGATLRNVGLTRAAITGRFDVGGLVGWNSGGTISNSYATGTVSGVFLVGGLVGVMEPGTLSGSHASVSVSDISGGVGGGTISGSYASGNVSGASIVGGLVGYNNSAISGSYASGSVSGIDYVGGLAGNASTGTVSDSYASGSVSGTNYVGGLAGNIGITTRFGGDPGTVNTSYATGAVSGTSNVGGLIGEVNVNSTVTNSYWDTTTTGQAGGFGGNAGTATNVVGLTTAQAMTQASFTGFDFTNTWWMSDTNTRPFLRNEYSTTITNAHQLQLMGMNATTLAASYTLGANINMAELSQASGMWNTTTGFLPVGDNTINLTGTFNGISFTGTFDGLGHTITGLTINRPAANSNFIGLFGNAGTGSVIKNVGLVGGSVSGWSAVGGLAGWNDGTISNSYNTGAIISAGAAVGGLVGRNNGTISNSYSTGAIDGSGTNGGLVGANYGTISNSYSTGAVIGGVAIGGLVGLNETGAIITDSYSTGAVTETGSGWEVGGLVGYNYHGTITNSHSTGAVTGGNDSVYVGGLVGYHSHGTIANSYSTGAVTSGINGSFVGGLVGINDGSGSSSTITNSYSTGAVSCTAEVGGLAGANVSGTITDSYSTGAVSGINDSGGLVGWNNSNGAISNSYSTGNVTGTSSFVGGLVAANDGTITNSYSTGSATGTGYVGGLVGSNDASGAITDSYSTGSVTGTGDYVGGLAGKNVGTITNSYSTGSASGANYVGGLAGWNNGGIITNTYSTGSESGYGFVGGLVGLNNGNGAISNSYSTGSVTSGGVCGGLVGVNGGTITNSYWDTTTSGTLTGIGGATLTGATGLTTAEMMTMASFATWDIDNAGGTGKVWRIYAGNTNPLLRSFLTSLTVTANDASKTYDGLAYSGGNGIAYSTVPNANLLGAASYGDTSQGAINAGGYVITPGGFWSNQQGYDITFADGALTVNTAALNVTANAASKTYDGAAYSGGNGVAYSGFVNGETSAALGGTLAYGGSAQGAINVGNYAITPSGLTSGNYTIAFNDGSLAIDDAIVPTVPGAPVDGYSGAIASVVASTTTSGSPSGSAVAIAGGSTSASSGAAFLTVDSGESAAGGNIQVAALSNAQEAASSSAQSAAGSAQSEGGSDASSSEDAAADSFATEYSLVTHGCGQRLPSGLGC